MNIWTLTILIFFPTFLFTNRRRFWERYYERSGKPRRQSERYITLTAASLLFSLSISSWYYSRESWKRAESEALRRAEAERAEAPRRLERIKAERARLEETRERFKGYIDGGARVERIDGDKAYLVFPDGRSGYLEDLVAEDHRAELERAESAVPEPEGAESEYPESEDPESEYPEPEDRAEGPAASKKNKQNPKYQQYRAQSGAGEK